MYHIGHHEVVRHRELELREAAETARRLDEGHRGRGRREISPPRRQVRESR
jgi:hypothetical protein